MGWLQFFLWVASFLISDYFRERLPSQTPAGVGDFNIPTATEGRVVGVVVGTMRVDAPNCIWYGNFRAEEKTVTTGIVFKEDEVVGYRYRLALQYALGKFEAAGITRIYIGDDKVWDYVEDNGGNIADVVDVAEPDLFGGDDSGGGFVGRFRLFNGADDQPVSDYLQNVAGLDPLPAYQGTCYVMVTNASETSIEGFRIVESVPETAGAYIGDSNQLRYIRIEVQTFDTVANGGLSDTLQLGNDHHFIGPDLNPIEFAYQLFRNDRWGRAFPASDVDVLSFRAAAETCFTEGIGFSWIFDELRSTGDILDVIEQHVDGYIGPNPITGQIEVTLSRPDYILANEFQATDDNTEVEKWNKGDWSQTFNRVRVRFVDRDKDWNETSAIQLSPGNRIIQGRTVTKELRYEGCHTASVAALLAGRSNRTLSLPQSSGTLLINREGWELRPGSILSLTQSQADETDLACRVTKIELGDGIRNILKAEVVADISGNELGNVADPPPTDFVPPTQNVDPFAVLDQAALETPRLFALATDSPNTALRITTLARRQLPSVPTRYRVLQRNSAGVPSGAYTEVQEVAAGFTVCGELRNDLAQAQANNGTLSIVVDPIGSESLDGLLGTYAPSTPGNFAGVAVISPGLPEEEFVLFTSVVDDLAGVRLEGVYRSGFDTRWKAHTAGERVWFVWTGGLAQADQEYPAGRNVEIKLLPESNTDAVAEGDATALPIVTMDDNLTRWSSPLVPVSVTLNGTEFPASADFDTVQSGPTVTGVRVVPTHRYWLTDDALLQVQAFGVDGPLLTGDGTEYQWWLHDLDQFPNADRGDAVASSGGFVAVADQQDPFDIAKADVVAGGAEGADFNARLEIETRHSSPGFTALQESYEAFEFDFVALGVFSLIPSLQVTGSQFNGQDTETTQTDENNIPIQFLGNAEIDTASAAFGGSSLILPGTAGDVVHMASPKGFRWYDNDWTIDFRVRFDDIVTTNQVIIGAGWLPFRRTWYLEWNNPTFNLRFSRSGNDGPFGNIGLGSFSPVAGTWYAFRLVSRNQRWSLYVDGTRIGTTFTSQSHIDAGCDWVIGARWNGTIYDLPFTGQVDELQVYNRAGVDPNETSYTVANQAGFGNLAYTDMLVANFEDVDGSTTYKTDDLNRYALTFNGTSEVDTAQSAFGTASLRCDGNDSTTTGVQDGVQIDFSDVDPRFDLDEDDWTMQVRVRFITLPSTKTHGMALIARLAYDFNPEVDWWFGVNEDDDVCFEYSWGFGSTPEYQGIASPPVSIAVDTWYHIAAQRRGLALELYFDGTRILNDTTFFDNGPGERGLRFSSSRTVCLGGITNSDTTLETRSLNGFLDGVQIVRGIQLFDGATYTVPTVPPAAGDRNPEPGLLLLNGWDGLPNGYATDRAEDTQDAGRGTRFTFTQNAQIRTNVSKFGGRSLQNGGSPSDGVVYTPSIFWWDLADGDFTLDFWFNRRTTSINASGIAFLNHWQNASDQRGWRFYWDLGTDELRFEWSTDGTAANEKRAYVSSVPVGTFTQNVFVHLAVERDGSALNIYINGTLQTLDVGSDSIGSDTIFNPQNAELIVGRQVDAPNGYLFANFDEIRLIKSAEYGSASFTPETSEYPRPASNF